MVNFEDGTWKLGIYFTTTFRLYKMFNREKMLYHPLMSKYANVPCRTTSSFLGSVIFFRLVGRPQTPATCRWKMAPRIGGVLDFCHLCDSSKFLLGTGFH